jgi:hypothetical protein
MHYRNGREAKNGDLVVQLGSSYEPGSTEPKVRITGIGILFNATPGNDYCNGSLAPTLGGPVVGACMCDCIHADDLADILKEKGLDKRPAGK